MNIIAITEVNGNIIDGSNCKTKVLHETYIGTLLTIKQKYSQQIKLVSPRGNTSNM